MWGSTAVLLLLLPRPRRGGLVILLLTAIITTILVTITTTGAMVDDVNVVAAMVMAMVVVIVEVVDLIEDDRGPTLLATTRIGIDVVAAVVGEGEGDTAVVALERVIGTIIIGMAILLVVVVVMVVVAAGDIMEDHRIEDQHHRTMPESRHMHPNDMQNSQCYVDFFGRRSWRKNRLSMIIRR